MDFLPIPIYKIGTDVKLNKVFANILNFKNGGVVTFLEGVDSDHGR
jgi:hypothetical protein